MIGEATEIRAEGKNHRLHQLRHGADAARYRSEEARGARAKARHWRGRNSAKRVHRSLRESTSINSPTLRRCSPLLPDAIACSTQCATWSAGFPPRRGASAARTADELGHDVDAIAVVLDHAREAAHLAFDAFQALEHRGLGIALCMPSIYPYGVSVSRHDLIVDAFSAAFARTTESTGDRSGLRDDGRSGNDAAPRTSTTATPTLSAAPAAAPSSSPTRRNICKRGRASPTPTRRKARSTPARCIRRSGRSVPALARSAAWRWSPKPAAPTMAQPELADMTRRFWIAWRWRCRSSCSTWAGISVRLAPTVAHSVELDPVRARRRRWCCGRGWPFFVRGWAIAASRAISTCSR